VSANEVKVKSYELTKFPDPTPADRLLSRSVNDKRQGIYRPSIQQEYYLPVE